jgi:phosphoglycerate dehydrogenase-like enzyme
MNRRAFLTGAAAASGLATTVTAASPGHAREHEGKRLRVLVPTIDSQQAAELTAVAPEMELVVCPDAREALKHAPEAAASYGFITREILAAGKHLKWVQQDSAGVEHLLEFPELVESDIILTNMQRVFGPEIADQALGYLLCFTRKLAPFIIRRSAEEWWRPGPKAVFDELEGKTLLVIGLGGIGSQIARRASAFGMRCLATDPKVLEKPEYVEELHRPDSFHRLLPRADVVASAVPLTPGTAKMIGAGEFATMKRGVILINVSRGGVVDTAALVSALASGQVAAAGLDVTAPEPLPRGHPLWRQNVIITPHTAGQSPEGKKRAFALFKENLRRFASGEMLLNIVDKRAGY